MYSIVTFDRWWHIYHLALIKRRNMPEQQQGPYNKVSSQHTIKTPWYRHKNNITILEKQYSLSKYFLKGVVVVMLSYMLWTCIANMVIKYICDKCIQIFEYLNIFITLCFEGALRKWWVMSWPLHSSPVFLSCVTVPTPNQSLTQ